MGRLPTIPEYYKERINNSVDLLRTHQVPCDLHGEKEGRSFSYSPELNRWRCFGKCHCGGDVIDLHKQFYHLATREEAEASIRSLYDAPKNKFDISAFLKKPEVNQEQVRLQVAYNRAIARAVTPDLWLELDYILSEYPVDITKLEVFSNGN